jgi:ComF family protein
LSFKDFVGAVFFPKRCKYCEAVIDYRESVCKSCENNIPYISGEICNKCGCEISLCNCRKKSKYYESVCAPYYYEGPARQCIRQFKFKNGKHLADTLAEDMALCFKERYADIDFDFCTFVPAHKSTIRKRGYNQSQLLCRSLAEKINVPYSNILIKEFKTPIQHKLNEASRKGNLLGCFALQPKVKEQIRDARILLCDDIKTTGSTLDECAKTLLVNGAAEVRCITLCITKDKEKQ